MSLSTLNICLPSLCVFVNFKYMFAVFVCLCLSLGVFVNFKHLFAIFACLCVSLSTSNVFLLSLRVFVRLCPSLCVFARLCVVWMSLRYLDRPGAVVIVALRVKSAGMSTCTNFQVVNK